MKYSKEELLKMYEHLANGRIFTETMHKAVYAGLVRSSFHSPHGQEAIGVGIVSAMNGNDWLAPTHRLQTASIMRFDLYQFVAEIFAKKDGMHKGVAFDFHCSDFSEGIRMLPPFGTLGGIVPAYTGFAWSLKQQKKEEVVVIVHGDGGCSEGTVYEGWNIASLYKVPVVFVIENNEWAMTVPLRRQTTNENISDRAIPMGLSTQVVDGNDILAVREAMEIALIKARNNEPNVVELKTLRWDAHYVGQGSDYRGDVDKIEEYKKNNDPVKRFEGYLLEEGIIDEAYIKELKERLTKQMDEIVERASKAPVPELNDVYKKEYIYANVTTGGEL